MLVALLLDMPLGPPHPIEGLAELNTHEKLFMLNACCAEMIAETLWIESLANREQALHGLEALIEGIKNTINSRIEGEWVVEGETVRIR